MLYDVKRAIAWLRSHADELRLDPDCFVVAGESAGGHMALLCGLTQNVAAYQAGEDMGDADTRVHAVVDLYGVTDWTDSERQYASRDARPGGIRGFLEKLVLRKQYERHTAEYVRGSPLWWVYGSTLPQALARTEAGAALGLRSDAIVTSGMPAAPAAAAVAAAAAGGVEEGGEEGGEEAAESPGDVHAMLRSEAEHPPPAREGLRGIADMCVDRAVPPVFIVHGTCDTLVPLRDSELLWDALRARRVRDRAASSGTGPDNLDVFTVLPGAHHAFNFVPSFRTSAMCDAVEDWLAAVYARVKGRPLPHPSVAGEEVRPRL